MSAEDCLNHSWLARRSEPTVQHMDTAKDNLRQFVERWNEHPNSPYVFETASHFITPCSGTLQLSSSLHSLEALSPSPCGSLASSVGSDDNTGLLVPDIPESFRRASESSYFVRNTNVVERINLADEIRKLTDKLFLLSTIPDTPEGSPRKSNPIEIKQTRTRAENGTTDSPSGAPWRRQKFRITSNSRDVPLQSRNSTAHSFSSQLDFSFKSKTTSSSKETTENSSMDSAVNGTKDMLLKLLEQWDGPHPTPQRPNVRHGSVSTEWSEQESLGQRTISSLNMFFQSRSTVKKSHPFLNHNGLN